MSQPLCPAQRPSWQRAMPKPDNAASRSASEVIASEHIPDTGELLICFSKHTGPTQRIRAMQLIEQAMACQRCD